MSRLGGEIDCDTTSVYDGAKFMQDNFWYTYVNNQT